MVDPLVPANVDLRGYEFMPLYGHHLFRSEFDAKAGDTAWRVAVTLWWAAWNQVPAASLPDDDVALTKFADLGRDVRAFRKVREQALHGFVLCSDGRLYHRKLSQWALEAWDRRVKERERKARWRDGKHRDGDVPETGTSSGTEPGQNRDVPSLSPLKRSEAKVSELQKRDVGVTPTDCAREHGGVSGNGADRKIAKSTAKSNGGQQWSSPAWVKATAMTIGLTKRTNESDADFKDRVYCAVRERQNAARTG